MAPRWDGVIADWAAWLDELERALDSDDWAVITAAGDFTPPGEALADIPEDQATQVAQRVSALQERSAQLKQRLAEALDAAAGDVSEHRRRSAAARRYLSDGG